MSFNGSESGGVPLPRQVLRLFRPAIPEIQPSGEKEGRTMNPLIQVKTPSPLFLVALLLASFSFVPLAQAVLPAPSPDGGYPGGNTAEGTNALHALTTGLNNTAVGASALESNNVGGYNVAIGGLALADNVDGQ